MAYLFFSGYVRPCKLFLELVGFMALLTSFRSFLKARSGLLKCCPELWESLLLLMKDSFGRVNVCQTGVILLAKLT